MYIEPNPITIPDSLADILAELPKAALAFSGGVDSSYLLYAAKACGMDVRAYYVHSQFQPRFEWNDVRRVADELQADLTVISLDALQNPVLVANPPDRCYHCKRMVFGQILRRAQDDGYTLLMDGSNASDDANARPGMLALQELAVRSPLREAGLTKEEVRHYSQKAGLFTWDKPAYACLATRIPMGCPITADMLQKVEIAEDVMFQMGFTDFRVRSLGSAAKLQVPAAQIPQAAQRHKELTQALSPWFSDVFLDLKPR